MMKVFYARLSTPSDWGSSGVDYLVVSFDGHLPLLKRLEKELAMTLGAGDAGEDTYEVEPRVEIIGFDSEKDRKGRVTLLKECIEFVESVEVCLPDGESFGTAIGGAGENLFWIGRLLDETFSVGELAELRKKIFDPEDPLCFEFLVETQAVNEFLSLDWFCKAEEEADGLEKLALECVENRVAMAAGWLQVHPVPLITRAGENSIRIDWKNGGMTERGGSWEASYPASCSSPEDAMEKMMAGLKDEKGEEGAWDL